MSGLREVLREEKKTQETAPTIKSAQPSSTAPLMTPHPPHTLQTGFPRLEGQVRHSPYGERPRSWPSVSNPRLVTTWHELLDEPRLQYDHEGHDKEINMTSVYYWISKGDPISQARETTDHLDMWK